MHAEEYAGDDEDILLYRHLLRTQGPKPPQPSDWGVRPEQLMHLQYHALKYFEEKQAKASRGTLVDEIAEP